MHLIAFRPEYQISVDLAKNRIFYQNFGPMQNATRLPNYLPDWTAALAEVSPGFSILSDMQVVNQVAHPPMSDFQTVEQLLVQHGVRIVAEVHVPGRPTRRHCDEVTTARAMPVHHFLTIWEGSQFLDDL